MKNKIMIVSINLILGLSLSACYNNQTNPTKNFEVEKTINNNIFSQSESTYYPGPDLSATYPESIEETTYPGPIINENSLQAPPLPTTTPNPKISPLIIISVTNNNDIEEITLKNISNIPQDLKLYTIVEPNSQKFKQFESEILLPNQTITIYNGATSKNLSSNQKWLSEPLLIVTFDQLYLLNEAGRIIWTYTKMP